MSSHRCINLQNEDSVPPSRELKELKNIQKQKNNLLELLKKNQISQKKFNLLMKNLMKYNKLSKNKNMDLEDDFNSEDEDELEHKKIQEKISTQEAVQNIIEAIEEEKKLSNEIEEEILFEELSIENELEEEILFEELSIENELEEEILNELQEQNDEFEEETLFEELSIENEIEEEISNELQEQNKIEEEFVIENEIEEEIEIDYILDDEETYVISEELLVESEEYNKEKDQERENNINNIIKFKDIQMQEEELNNLTEANYFVTTVMKQNQEQLVSNYR